LAPVTVIPGTSAAAATTARAVITQRIKIFFIMTFSLFDLSLFSIKE
jgi:hypothetical protein